MRITLAGPCTTGGAGGATRAARLAGMDRTALRPFRMDHEPVAGVNMALPVIAAGKPVFRSIEEAPPCR